MLIQYQGHFISYSFTNPSTHTKKKKHTPRGLACGITIKWWSLLGAVNNGFKPMLIQIVRRKPWPISIIVNTTHLEMKTIKALVVIGGLWESLAKFLKRKLNTVSVKQTNVLTCLIKNNRRLIRILLFLIVFL